MNINQLSEVFDEIIIGKNVKRNLHFLVYDDKDFTELFLSRLKYNNFNELYLSEVQIKPGERIPGFLIRNRNAIFGYLEWEIFNENFKRLLWGSVVKNKKGDWKYTVSVKSKHKVWLNRDKLESINLPSYLNLK